MTQGENPLLSFAADAFGSFSHVLTEAWFLPGQGPLTMPTLHQEGSPLFTREGNGAAVLWRVEHTLPALVNALVTVTLWACDVSDVDVC